MAASAAATRSRNLMVRWKSYQKEEVGGIRDGWRPTGAGGGGDCGELLGHEPDAQVEIAEAERRAGVERWQARDQLGAARGAVQQGDAAEVDTLRGEGLDRPLRGAPVHDARGGSGGGEGEGPEAIHHAPIIHARALGVLGALGTDAFLRGRAVGIVGAGRAGGDAARSHPALSGVRAAGATPGLYLDREVELQEGGLRGPSRGRPLLSGHEVRRTVADAVVRLRAVARFGAGAVAVVGAGLRQGGRAVPLAPLTRRATRIIRAQRGRRDAAVSDLAARRGAGAGGDVVAARSRRQVDRQGAHADGRLSG